MYVYTDEDANKTCTTGRWKKKQTDEQNDGRRKLLQVQRKGRVAQERRFFRIFLLFPADHYHIIAMRLFSLHADDVVVAMCRIKI